MCLSQSYQNKLVYSFLGTFSFIATRKYSYLSVARELRNNDAFSMRCRFAGNDPIYQQAAGNSEKLMLPYNGDIFNRYSNAVNIFFKAFSF